MAALATWSNTNILGPDADLMGILTATTAFYTAFGT